MKMKYEAEIKAGRDVVWAAFDNPDNLSRWQPALESFTPVSGEPRQPGSVSELVYKEKGKKITARETVTERREPLFLAGTIDNAWATTLIVHHFEEIDEHNTRFVSYTNTQFKGIMKLMSLFVARSIRTRAQADLDRFKLFVETETAGGSQ
jgi:uncharacterized protein YndB with AHSA1/START domain